MHDILIVGGGPAGLTAALYAARAGKTVAVLEQAAAGGQILNAPLVENYPGLPEISGADLAAALEAQTEALGVELLYEEATGARRTAEGFQVSTDLGTHDCRALILALGAKHRPLGLPREETLTGAGVSYCAVCDGAFYTGKHVVVVGGGDTALQDALFLSNLCEKVTVLVRRDRFRGEAARAERLRERPNVEILFCHTPEAFLTDGNGVMSGISVRSGGILRDIPAEGIFVAVGQRPESGAFAGLVPASAEGYFIAGEDTVTETPGVFVAGDCRTKPVRQLTTAVADGTEAALAACGWLER